MTASSPRSVRTHDAGDLRRLGWSARLLRAWTSSPRRRRLLVLGLAAPGFVLITTTPLHRTFGLLALGTVLFAAALIFRRQTEPAFVRAEAAGHWPPPPSAPWEIPHA
jgi:hypothetical protein